MIVQKDFEKYDSFFKYKRFVKSDHYINTFMQEPCHPYYSIYKLFLDRFYSNLNLGILHTCCRKQSQFDDLSYRFDLSALGSFLP